MTPLDALHELLSRLEALGGKTLYIRERELERWPPDAVAALKSQKLIVRSGSATGAICPGCEMECTMPVERVVEETGETCAFVVCDKPVQMGRVMIGENRLIQWRSDRDVVARFLCTALAVRRSAQKNEVPYHIALGYKSGKSKHGLLYLKYFPALMLVAGETEAPLVQAISYKNGTFVVMESVITRLIDSSRGADGKHVPSNVKRELRKQSTELMRDQWRKEHRKLMKEKPGMNEMWYAKKIALLPMGKGRSFNTIRKALEH